MWLATDGCPAHVRDIDTGERRFSTRQDLAGITRIADALPEIGFMGVPVSATDMPVSVRPLYETRAQLANTTKHIQNGTAIDAVNARGMAEMCRVVAGSSEALRERASVSGFQGSISPLHWDEESLEAMRIYAEPGIPVALCSMPIGGATASGTVVEMTTLGHAEVLSGIAILKTMVPGAKVVYANYASTMDLYSGAVNLVWGADDLLIAPAQLGAHLDIPVHAGGYGSGAKLEGWQSGVQDASAVFMIALALGDLVIGAGSMYGSGMCSLTSLLLHCELFDCLARWAEGSSFEDEDFGLDAIDEVGPGGHFLASKHTLEHREEFWQSKVHGPHHVGGVGRGRTGGAGCGCRGGGPAHPRGVRSRAAARGCGKKNWTASLTCSSTRRRRRAARSVLKKCRNGTTTT